MTDKQRASERLRAANPLPECHVDADELGRFVSHFEERRDAMSGIKTIHRDDSTRKAPRRLTPGLVFATSLVAVLVLLGGTLFGTMWLMQGEDAPSEGVTPAAEAPARGSQDDDATPPAASPVVAQPETEILSDSPEYLATVGTGPDGLPIVASQRFLPGDDFGTVRFFFCTNAACDDYEVVEVAEEQWLGRELDFTVAPSGDIYLMYGGFDDGEKVMVYRNSELTEVALPFNFPPGEGHSMAILPSAFLDDGRPVFAGVIGDHKSLVVCDDSTCTGSTEVVLEETGGFAEWSWAHVDGQDIQVVYAVASPIGPPDPEAGYDGATMEWTTRIATVSDIDGAPKVVSETVNEGINEFPIGSTMAADGSVVMWLFSWQEQEVPGEPLTAYSTLSCEDSGCTKEPAAAMGGWASPFQVSPDFRLVNAIIEDVYDPAEYEAYLEEERRISEAGLDEGADMPDALGTNLVVGECVDAACSAAVRYTIDAREGWWYLDSLGMTVSQDGTSYILVGSSGEAGDPGLTLYSFPAGTLDDLVEPIEGTAVIR